MTRLRLHPERHLVGRIGWLRAAVLGANDGIVSTASLIVGVAAAAATQNAVLIAGVAGLVAGAMSMAAGEYVSVSSQSDTERADLARERKELSDNVEFEKEELAEIYIKRGLEPSLARQVAQQLMAKDALTAHARDELGISEITGRHAAIFPVALEVNRVAREHDCAGLWQFHQERLMAGRVARRRQDCHAAVAEYIVVTFEFGHRVFRLKAPQTWFEPRLPNQKLPALPIR